MSRITGQSRDADDRAAFVEHRTEHERQVKHTVCGDQAGLQQRRLGAAAERLQRATRPNQVWSYDFVSVGTERGGRLRILAVPDEFSRKCPALYVARSISSRRVIHLPGWLLDEQCQTLYIRPGSPWENAFIERFNGKLRAE